MKNILIVDDEPHVLRVLSLALQKANYQVDSAQNGDVALAKVRQSAPDLLITDIQMPRMNGLEMCFRIQKEMPHRDFPIFISTSRTDISQGELASRIPNIYFMEKPVSVRKLTSMINSYFQGV